VVTDGGLDAAATEQRRGDCPEAKAFHRGEYADVLG
jgi:hypothetical protein